MRISDWSSDVCSSDLAGVLCMPTVGALKHAVKAVELGADIITVQGAEGGGHTGSVPTTLLLPQVLDAVKVPVVAAGGFHSGRGLAGALAFGAAEIGRASCWGGVCQHVEISVGAVSLKKKNIKKINM